MRHDQDKGGRMGDNDIDNAARELVVAILQGLKPAAVPIAVGTVVGAYKFTKGAIEMVKSKCSTPEQRERIEAVQAAARPSARSIHGDDIRNLV